jgi:hypothetical protein
MIKEIDQLPQNFAPDQAFILLIQKLYFSTNYHYVITLDESQRLFQLTVPKDSLEVGNILKSLCYSRELANFAFIFVSTSLPTLWVNLELISPNHADFIGNAAKIYLDYSHVNDNNDWRDYCNKLVAQTNMPAEAAIRLFEKNYTNPAVCAFLASLWPLGPVQNPLETAEKVLNDAYDRIYRTVARGINLLLYAKLSSFLDYNLFYKLDEKDPRHPLIPFLENAVGPGVSESELNTSAIRRLETWPFLLKLNDK